MTKPKNATITKGILVVKRANEVKFQRVVAVINHKENNKNCVRCNFYKIPSTERNDDISKQLQGRILKVIDHLRNPERKSLISDRFDKDEQLNSNFENSQDQIWINSRSNSSTVSMESPSEIPSSIESLEDSKDRVSPMTKPIDEIDENNKNSNLENDNIDRNKPVGDIETEFQYDSNRRLMYLESKLRRLTSDESRLYLINLRRYRLKSRNRRESSGISEISGDTSSQPILKEISLSEIKLSQIKRNLTDDKQRPERSVDDLKSSSMIDLIDESNSSLIDRRRNENLQKFQQTSNLEYDFIDLPPYEHDKIDKGDKIDKIDKKIPKKCENCPNRISKTKQPTEVPEINCCCYWLQRICTII